MVMKELIRCDEETQKTFLTEVRNEVGLSSRPTLEGLKQANHVTLRVNPGHMWQHSETRSEKKVK